ncbi:MAG: right-handed parallel beta-helix repeat-containing protein [Planctomycetota bacterium]|jgi:hypothetical protein
MRVAASLILCLLCPMLCIAAIIRVPLDYPTIQDAVDAALDEDTVLVAAGTYMENIHVHGKAITIRSEEGAHATVLDGGSAGTVVTFDWNGEHESSLDGFTVLNGSSPSDGGGIVCDRSLVTIANNLIMDNDAATWGGGIYITGEAFPLIVNNVVAENSAWEGGGIYFYNEVDDYPDLVNTVIYGNTASHRGGGLRILHTGYTPQLANSILWDNYAGGFPDQIDGDPDATFCDIQGGYPGTGNINSDPLFVDPAEGDFHIPFDSPCRDAGDDAAAAHTEDFEGDPRIASGGVDMGADEFHLHLYHTGSVTPGGNIKGVIVGSPGAAPVGLFLGSGVLDPPANTMWGKYYLKPPWFLIVLWPIPSNGLMILPATLPGTPPAPYDLPMQALVTDSLTNLSILRVR